MESAEAPLSDRQLEAGLFAACVQASVDAMEGIASPADAIDAAVGLLHERVPGLNPSVFVLEHGRLWLVAQRGYAVVPDGLGVESGVTGRCVRLARPQLVQNVVADRDYVAVLPGVRSELAVPLRSGRVVVGALNVESERRLPDDAVRLVRPLAAAIAPRAEALRAGQTVDLAGLARLFVHLGSLRDPEEIAALAAAALAKVLRVGAGQVLLWNDLGHAVEIGSWTSGDGAEMPLDAAEIDVARGLAEPMFVCEVLERDRLWRAGSPSRPGSVVWLPLRANGEDLGVLAGVGADVPHGDPSALDTAAVLAAHVAASLDAAVVIERERRSAVTDSLTGILNRRGLEEHLEDVLRDAQELRVPVSLLVMDCDDFKEINDRAGHEFGDALLLEVAEALGRALPERATAARLGGDEFVVVLPEAGIDAAEEVGTRIRTLLSDGLTEAGFPLRISVGIATYPFDGGSATALLRAADQAMYAAKSRGKDCVASFRDVVGRAVVPEGTDAPGGERRGGPVRTDGSILAEAMEGAAAIEAEATADGVCGRLCKALVFVVGATACSASRVVEDLLVDTSVHSLRDVPIGQDVAYRISDFPVTSDVLRSGEPRAISFLDGDVDPAEAFVLRELAMNALLMLPLRVRGTSWGLVELYEMRLRRFTADDVAVARFLVAQAERRLETVASEAAPESGRPVYELPAGGLGRRGARTR